MRFPPRKEEDGRNKPDDGGNALWRIPEWFPDLSPEVGELLRGYHQELLKFNLKLNLISRNTEREADEVHFADCILGFRSLERVDLGPKVFDIGSGNGLPGLICAILDPRRDYFLVESDGRKAEFLKHVIHTLSLRRVQILNVRLETLKAMSMETALTRGFATISKTCLACNKIFPKGGRVFHFKGSSWSTEIAEIPSQLISVWAPELMSEFNLPVTQARRAVVCTRKKI